MREKTMLPWLGWILLGVLVLVASGLLRPTA